MKIGAVILAAGGSKRFGTPKQLLLVNNKRMLQHVLDLVHGIRFTQVVLVLGAYKEEIEDQLQLYEDFEVVFNPDWEKGQSTSVRKGVEALEKNCDAIIFFLADQPFTSQRLVRAEISAFGDHSPEILVPVFDAVRGNPVIFSKARFEELKSLKGDQGGRALFNKHKIFELSWAEKEENKDIDTLAEYGAIMSNKNAHSQLSTIILAAGLSTRMNEPKLVLPWGENTILGTVITSFQKAGMGEIVVVTGGYREVVEKEAARYHVESVFNKDFENGEMADSLKTGLSFLMNKDTRAVFVALADQPGISSYDIEEMAKLYYSEKPKMIIPSYEMRRGHPWLIDRSLWESVMKLHRPLTMRDFIEENRNEIVYYLVKQSNILDDLDTPEDYKRLRPR